ncbi:MAG TPA: GNAT family N-acetyltransferase [Patescibacteria group bacterium]|jgi:GNAT superfamily N-acetyltransferase|nr:GNAT family N-acetyltransferase [Patescibacteria group bacterium]
MKKKGFTIKVVEAAPVLFSAVNMAALGFAREESQALSEDVASHLASGEIVRMIFVNDLEAGFAIFAIYDDILYLSGIILLPEYQGNGIAALVINKVFELYPECSYLSLRTQSLRMYLAASRLCKDFYPKLNGEEIPESFAVRGSVVAKVINSQFPLHLGCYNGPLYGEKPVYKDMALQNTWDNYCNFERGDAIIFVGAVR